MAGVKNPPHPCKVMRRHIYVYVHTCVLVPRFAAVWGTLLESLLSNIQFYSRSICYLLSIAYNSVVFRTDMAL